MNPDAEYVLVAPRGRNDYYAGQYHSLYRNGILIWDGYSGDSVGGILDALGIAFEEREGPRDA